MFRFWKVSSALVIVVLALAIVTPIASSGTASAANTGSSTNQSVSVYFFYGNGCPHCAIVEPLIDNLAAKYPQVNFIKLEVWYNSANKALYDEFNAQYGVQNPVVPEVFVGGQVLIAENAIQTNLEPIIKSLIASKNPTIPTNNGSSQSAVVNASSSTNHSPSTSPSPSTNPKSGIVEAKKSAPKAPAVNQSSSPGTKSKNTSSSRNNSPQSANNVEAIKPTSKVPTVNKTTYPEVIFTTAENAIFNSSQAVINWNYTSGESNVSTAEVAIDNGTFNTMGSNFTSYIASGLWNGNHSFVLRISDRNNRSSDHSLNFTVDLASKKMDDQKRSNSLFSNPLLIGMGVFILIVGLSLVFIQRLRKKV